MKSTVRALVTHMRQRGLQQAEAAAMLGVSQGHLSKVITGRAPLSTRLQAAIGEMIEAQSQAPTTPPPLARLVTEALAESAEFRTLIRAALTLANKSRRS